MLDCSPPILALLVAAATALIALGLLGRRDRARPTCRACGKDARVAVEGSVARCACGADLYARRAVRWQRRRRWKLSVAGLLLSLATAAFGWLALHVRSNGPSWCVILPAPLYEMALRHQWEGARSESLALVMAKTPDKRTRQRYTDAVVESWAYTKGPLPSEGLMTLGTALRGGMPQDRGEALIGLLARSFSMDTMDLRADGRLSLRIARADIRSSIRGVLVLVRVDSVRLGDRELKWTVEGSFGYRRVPSWFSQVGEGGIPIQLPADVDLSSDTVRRELVVDATLAIVPFSRSDIGGDPSIARVADPASWNVDVVHGPFTMRGLTPFTPTAPLPTTSGPLEKLASARWNGLLKPPVAPSVALIPILEATLLGLGLGVAICVAAAVATLVRAPYCSICVPKCAGCGFALAPGQPLPSRCSECGRAVGGPDDAAWTGLESRPRLIAAWVLGLALVVGAAIGLERWAAAPLRRSLAAAFAAPERDVRWLVRETIAMRPYGIGGSPAYQLAVGQLASTSKKFGTSPALLRVAADEIIRWAEEGGKLPPPPAEPGVVGRHALATVLFKALNARDENGVPSATPEAVATAMTHLLGRDARATAPSVVRQGREIDCTPLPLKRDSNWPFYIQYLCEPRKVDSLGAATIRVRTLVRSDRVVESGPLTTPLLEIASDETVLVVAADAMRLSPEQVSDTIARGAPFIVSLEEGGLRDAVVLGNFLARGILWVGRWEVLGADGSVLGTFESTPEGGEAWGLASLPDPWPETLMLRFTAATTSRDGLPLPKNAHGVYWTGTVCFTFTADGDDRARQSRIRRYRLTDAGIE